MELRGVSYTYDARHPALLDISMTIGDGEVLGIVGPSGSGKSTLLQVLLRLRRPSSGEVLVGGVEYDAIKIIGAGGPIEVVPDPWCPDNVERLLNLDVWKLSSTGELIHWDDGAGPDDPMLEDAADAREVRAVGDIATECWDPWANVRVSVTA